MTGTIFSLILALSLIFVPLPFQVLPEPFLLSIVMIVAATVFLILSPLGLSLSWLPIQQTAQNTTSLIINMFRKDWRIHLANFWVMAFSLMTYVFSLVFVSENRQKNLILLAIWILLLGITRDVFVYFSTRVYEYLNPFESVEIFTNQAKKAIKDEREMDLCDWIDGIVEIAIKAVQKSSISNANNALNQLQEIARSFLAFSKSMVYHQTDVQSKSLGVTDKVSYTLFYLYQRLEIIFHKALEQKLEPTCSYILTVFGKIAIEAASYDLSLASVPLRSLGKLAKEAQEARLSDVPLKATCTLLEVGKVMVNEVDITYLELQEPFLSIINSLEELTKGAFKQDKSINLQLLKQPFFDLKELFTTGKAANHQDAPIIIQNIDRVIGEFDALEQVLRTIPSIPETGESIKP